MNSLPYAAAQACYAEVGVDTEAAISAALAQPIALHCWQADDVSGLEQGDGPVASGGLLATGNHPGRARTGDEMRRDLSTALRLLPGRHRLNLHALYADYAGPRVARDELTVDHFARWLDWCAQQEIGFDFNATYFAHPLAAAGATLSSADAGIRQFWVRHGIACRHIAEAAARRLNQTVILNHWIPDGRKDATIDRWSPRARLVESLDAILAAEVDRSQCRDAVEGKLFGLGTEDYTVGSHDFYSSLALTRGILLCLDMGHYHPTEGIADKLSALLPFHRELLIHVSRPMRWDSDHVVIVNDDLRALCQEIVRGRALARVHLATDYFDASINRVAAYVIGVRATRRALLEALLEPSLAGHERFAGETLARLEEAKLLPSAIVWAELCRRAEVPTGAALTSALAAHEAMVLAERGR